MAKIIKLKRPGKVGWCIALTSNLDEEAAAELAEDLGFRVVGLGPNPEYYMRNGSYRRMPRSFNIAVPIAQVPLWDPEGDFFIQEHPLLRTIYRISARASQLRQDPVPPIKAWMKDLKLEPVDDEDRQTRFEETWAFPVDPVDQMERMLAAETSGLRG